MARMTVLDAGFFMTIQDQGRISHRDYGVPQSGAMDQSSFTESNRLLSNSLNTPVLEMTMRGGKFMFSQPTTIAITGATCEVIHDSQVLLSPCVLNIKTGDVLEIGAAQDGNFIYLAIAGGFQVDSCFESSSYYPKILDQSLIKKGNHLEYESQQNALVNSRCKSNHYAKALTAFKGPEFHLLDREHQLRLLNNSFSISKQWNRMAFQLEELIMNDLESIKSSPVLPGTIQLTPQGKLIILMRDAQTTGGYPRILQLADDSISFLSQFTVDKKIDFRIKAF
ncbi:MAG: biotin-dependent carboxyltransferase family protein [Nonlabens sp.]|uniref:5-oxoprolinase subunit C family protein n=1 Tax=Nonlabens sp. TaxID=1888209 RepID=UPI003EFA8BAA